MKKKSDFLRSQFLDLIDGLKQGRMARLRKVQKQKYGELSGDTGEYIDSEEQDQLIENFKNSIDLTNSPGAKKVFQLYLGLIGIINLLLITLPCYRKNGNSIFSFLACIMIYIPAIYSYSIIHGIDYEQVKFFEDVRITWVSLIIYIFVMIIKFTKYRNNWTEDIIYVLPIMLGYVVVEMKNDERKINIRIEKLRKLKYNYKEA